MGCGQSSDVSTPQSPIRVKFVGAAPKVSQTLELSRLFPTLDAAVIADVVRTSENEEVAMHKLRALSPQNVPLTSSNPTESTTSSTPRQPAAASSSLQTVFVSSTHWGCPRCTYSNSLTLEACEVCGAEKPSLVAEQQQMENPHRQRSESLFQAPSFLLEGPQTCSLCLIDDLSPEEMHTLRGCGHSFCQDCLLDRWYTMGRGDENGFKGSLLHCPQCKKVVSSLQLRESIIPARLNFLLINERHRGDHQSAVAEQVRDREYLALYEKLEFEGYLSGGTQDIAVCPGKNCTYKFILPRGARSLPTCLHCPKCDLKSCAACKKSPFHYGTSCQEAGAIQANFVAVVQKLLPAGLKERDEQLANFEAKRKDEQYKQANCVCCPHCGRVAEHGGGCPSMVCGYTVSGSQNVGCGKSFRWDVAKRETPYVPTIPDTLPEAVQDVNRYLECTKDRRPVLGPRAKCAGCKKQITTGTYFECVCCRPDQPTFHCVKCVKKMVRSHPKDHFSRVHF